ncbi:MAG: hypothetical protein ACOVSW_12760 [Candidatus Kapaibacteriota bacterium]|jgi:hypothetical protein
MNAESFEYEVFFKGGQTLAIRGYLHVGRDSHLIYESTAQGSKIVAVISYNECQAIVRNDALLEQSEEV